MSQTQATPDERARPMPGDELIDSARLVTTRAVTIPAVRDDVWPWIVQMGQGRGGFYSYARLENLLGCRMRNASRIHSEWQNLSVGDPVPIHPRAEPLWVALLSEPDHLVLQSRSGFSWTWAFVIKETGEACRLLVRTRATWGSRALGLAIRPIMGPGHAFMERKMLRGIRQRVIHGG